MPSLCWGNNGGISQLSQPGEQGGDREVTTLHIPKQTQAIVNYGLGVEE